MAKAAVVVRCAACGRRAEWYDEYYCSNPNCVNDMRELHCNGVALAPGEHCSCRPGEPCEKSRPRPGFWKRFLGLN